MEEEKKVDIVENKSADVDMTIPDADKQNKFDAKFILYWLHLVGLFLLRLITLGLLGPYCECREQKYLAKHAIVGGYNLKFNGKAMQLIFKNMLWNLLSVLTLGIYLFVKKVKIEKWVIKHTKFKSKEDREGASHFKAGGVSYIGLGIKCFLVTLFSLGLAAPVALYWRSKYFVNHTVISGKNLYTTITIGDAYKFFFKCILLSIVTLGLYLIYLPFGTKKFHFSFIDMVDEEDAGEIVGGDDDAESFDEIARLSSDDFDIEAYVDEYASNKKIDKAEARAKVMEKVERARNVYDAKLTAYQHKHEKGKVSGILLQILSTIVVLSTTVLLIFAVIKTVGWLA